MNTIYKKLSSYFDDQISRLCFFCASVLLVFVAPMIIVDPLGHLIWILTGKLVWVSPRDALIWTMFAVLLGGLLYAIVMVIAEIVNHEEIRQAAKNALPLIFGLIGTVCAMLIVIFVLVAPSYTWHIITQFTDWVVSRDWAMTSIALLSILVIVFIMETNWWKANPFWAPTVRFVEWWQKLPLTRIWVTFITILAILTILFGSFGWYINRSYTSYETAEHAIYGAVRFFTGPFIDEHERQNVINVACGYESAVVDILGLPTYLVIEDLSYIMDGKSYDCQTAHEVGSEFIPWTTRKPDNYTAMVNGACYNSGTFKGLEYRPELVSLNGVVISCSMFLSEKGVHRDDLTYTDDAGQLYMKAHLPENTEYVFVDLFQGCAMMFKWDAEAHQYMPVECRENGFAVHVTQVEDLYQLDSGELVFIPDGWAFRPVNNPSLFCWPFREDGTWYEWHTDETWLPAYDQNGRAISLPNHIMGAYGGPVMSGESVFWNINFGGVKVKVDPDRVTCEP